MKQAAPPPGSTVCPQCNVKGPVRLAPGQVCAACQAQNAWELRDGERMIISKKVIAEVEKRRAGEAANEKKTTWLWWVVPPALALVLAGVASFFVWKLAAPRPIGSLSKLLSEMRVAGALATVLGFHAFAIASLALWRLRKGRHFRRAPLLAANLLAVVGGVITGSWGGLNWLGGGLGYGMDHDSMPARTALITASPLVDKIMGATAVIVAPDKTGDGRGAALGTGAVIAARGNRAWLVTCSHVAMPYAAVSTFRDAARAHPVWVQFSDGREALGKITWTARPPLDVAVIETTLDAPPAPIAISSDTQGMDSGSEVMFVPNPYRDGWMVHRGIVQRREEHLTPAGPYSLLFTDLPVQPGDSGSGLFDAAGQLVGINTWTRIRGGLAPQGISLPSEAMRTIVRAIEANQLDRLDQLLPSEGAAMEGTQ